MKNGNKLLPCPTCGQMKITRVALAASLFRVFSYPKCDNCNQKFFIGKSWQENTLGILALAVFASAYFSEEFSSKFFYFIPMLLAGFAFTSAYAFAKPVSVVSLSGTKKLLHWMVVAVVAVFIVYLLQLESLL